MMGADPDPSSQASAKISEKEAINNPVATESSDEVTAGEDPPQTAHEESPKDSTSTEAPTKKLNAEQPPISARAEPLTEADDIVPCPPDVAPRDSLPSMFSSSGLSSWAKNLKFSQQDSKAANSGVSAFARFTTGIARNFPAKGSDGSSDTKSPNTQVGGALESFTKGVVDSSRSAVKAVQVKARHIVSQNKRRYQEGEFDLDMTYITENIIAMGFPAGDLSSGLFGFFEGLYRNHMEEVIKFFETHHKGKYKVYNLCSERLYDASRFQGKLASFPFDDHNCPPIQLILSFCQSAYSWLKEDIQNVVVVHCKAGMARTGLMICCLLLFLKFFPTAEEAIDYYNQKRCVDGKALVLPSQIRYVKYYERVLTNYNGKIPAGRRCMLRGFRLINCPYWIRPAITISDHSGRHLALLAGVLFSTRKHPKTKDLMPEDFWIKAPRKGVVVFALPGERGLTELAGDFKIHFHESQGDFYCWLNTTMTENRRTLTGGDLDGFEKRKLPAPGFQVELVMIDFDGTPPTRPKSVSSSAKEPQSGSSQSQTKNTANSAKTHNEDNDNVFSDDDGEEPRSSKPWKPQVKPGDLVSGSSAKKTKDLLPETEGLAINETPKPKMKPQLEKPSNKTSVGTDIPVLDSVGASNIKAIAADASVFSFGDEEDYESD